MKKVTAVEWLVEQLDIDIDNHWAINQAKEMEKQQIIYFAEQCLDKALDLDVRTVYSQIEQYYTKTFKL